MAKGPRGGFPGGMGGGMGNMNQLMQQAQRMQREMEKAQEEIAALTADASAAGFPSAGTASGTCRSARSGDPGSAQHDPAVFRLLQSDGQRPV